MKLSDGNNRTIRFPGFDQFACGERQTANQNVISIKIENKINQFNSIYVF